MKCIITTSCEVCSSTVNLQICKDCQVVQYCGQRHQEQDAAQHAEYCKSVKNCRSKLELAIINLGAHAPIKLEPPDDQKDWWKRRPSKKSKPAIFGYWNCLWKLAALLARDLWGGTENGHRVSILALQERQKLYKLSLWIGFHGTYRMQQFDRLPHILLRLGKMQESYDYMKWLVIHSTPVVTQSGVQQCDMQHSDVSYMDIKGVDVLESVEAFILYATGKPDTSSFTRIQLILLIKLKLLQDVRDLHKSNLIANRVPTEILIGIRRELLGTHPICDNCKIMESLDHSLVITELEKQVHMLYDAIQSRDAAYWQKFFAGQVLLSTESRTAWAESPGALEILQHLMGKSAEECEFIITRASYRDLETVRGPV